MADKLPPPPTQPTLDFAPRPQQQAVPSYLPMVSALGALAANIAGALTNRGAAGNQLLNYSMGLQEQRVRNDRETQKFDQLQKEAETIYPQTLKLPEQVRKQVQTQLAGYDVDGAQRIINQYNQEQNLNRRLDRQERNNLDMALGQLGIQAKAEESEIKNSPLGRVITANRNWMEQIKDRPDIKTAKELANVLIKSGQFRADELMSKGAPTRMAQDMFAELAKPSKIKIAIPGLGEYEVPWFTQDVVKPGDLKYALVKEQDQKLFDEKLEKVGKTKKEAAALRIKLRLGDKKAEKEAYDLLNKANEVEVQQQRAVEGDPFAAFEKY